MLAASRLLLLWLRAHLVYFRYYLGRRPVVVVADPDMLRQVMVRDFSSFPNRMVRTVTKACTCTLCAYWWFWHKLRWCDDNRCLCPYSPVSLCRLFALPPSPWLTVCSCWGMSAGRECGASWPRHSVLPRWKRWDMNVSIERPPNRMSWCLFCLWSDHQWLHDPHHRHLRENVFVF